MDWLIQNEYSILYAFSFISFIAGLITLIGVLLHWLYFHNDRKHKLSWVISILLAAIALYVFSAGLVYDSSIFYILPEEYHQVAYIRMIFKGQKTLTTVILLGAVWNTIRYYLKYMRRKD